MDYIHTLYIDKNKDPFRDSFGWAAPEYHLMGWALSCLQLHKLYGKITLYANTQAAHLLIDTLKLPYSAVNLSHDQLTLIYPDLWALPKIYTYSLQEQPFLHIDGDVFLFKPFHSALMDGDLILGGANVSFFREYAATAFEYVNKNADSLQYINKNMFNIFFEQHLFYALAKEKGLAVSVIYKDIIKDLGYKNVGDFHEVPFNKNYLHLLGHFKREEFICVQMAAKLRELYPHYYDRIVALFFDLHIRLSPSGFLNHPASKPSKAGKDMSTAWELSNTHLQRVKTSAKQDAPDTDKELFQRDFEAFYKHLVSVLINTDLSVGDLRKRDLNAQHWYRDLFAIPATNLDKLIIRCKETEIIESSFDRAKLFNKYYRTQTGNTNNIQTVKGHFFNLIVYEATDNGFSLYDINELDHALLQLLSEPHTVHDTLMKMQIYFDEDVLQNHYDLYEKLFFISLKQLVLAKAIQPL